MIIRMCYLACLQYRHLLEILKNGIHVEFLATHFVSETQGNICAKVFTCITKRATCLKKKKKKA